VRTRDLAGWLLDAGARLLPAQRAEWGRAMRAELIGIASGRERWRFALSCLRAVLRQPAALGRVGYGALVTAALAAVIALTGPIAYHPLRLGVIGVVGVLLALSWLGRRSGLIGPVAAGRPARIVRTGGYVLVTVLTVAFISGLLGHGSPQDQLAYGVPIFGLGLAGYLLGFLALTSGRSAVPGSTLAVSGSAGVGAAVLWLASVLIWPPIPHAIGTASLAIAAAMLAAALITGAERYRHAMLAAFGAGTVGSLLITFQVVLLSSVGPQSLIPDLAPAALSLAEDQLQSRSEIQDPYVGLLALGWLFSMALAVTSIAIRRPTTTTTPHQAHTGVTPAR
jgi:hypothetical protein